MNVTDQPQLRVVWQNLAKHYGSRQIWNNVEGEISTGEVLVILGPNGSGKSTLLKLFAGLEYPSFGHISYHIGQQVLSPRLARPFLGVVAPDMTIYQELTAWENMQFFGRVAGLKQFQSHSIAILKQVGLEDRMNDRVASFSSGMVLRMKYAVNLLRKPLFLLLDEPTALFDEAGRLFVEQLVDQYRQFGITIIATNDSREVAWADLVLETPMLSHR